MKKTATLVDDKYNPTKNTQARSVWGNRIEVTPIGNNKTSETQAEIRQRLAREREAIFSNGQSKLRTANFGGQEEM